MRKHLKYIVNFQRRTAKTEFCLVGTTISALTISLFEFLFSNLVFVEQLVQLPGTDAGDLSRILYSPSIAGEKFSQVLPLNILNTSISNLSQGKGRIHRHPC